MIIFVDSFWFIAPRRGIRNPPIFSRFLSKTQGAVIWERCNNPSTAPSSKKLEGLSGFTATKAPKFIILTTFPCNHWSDGISAIPAIREATLRWWLISFTGTADRSPFMDKMIRPESTSTESMRTRTSCPSDKTSRTEDTKDVLISEMCKKPSAEALSTNTVTNAPSKEETLFTTPLTHSSGPKSKNGPKSVSIRSSTRVTLKCPSFFLLTWAGKTGPRSPWEGRTKRMTPELETPASVREKCFFWPKV